MIYVFVSGSRSDSEDFREAGLIIAMLCSLARSLICNGYFDINRVWLEPKVAESSRGRKSP
jgi:hypothetical protein